MLSPRANFKFLTVILLVMAGLYVFANFNRIEVFLGAKFRQYFTYSSCDKPLAYKLGDIDPKFGLTKEQFLADTKQAAQIWQKAEVKQVLTFDATAGNAITINLTYDQRTALNNQINNLEQQVTRKDQSLQSDVNAYQKQVDDFKKRLADFHNQVLALNQQIDYWNQKGGAPADVYQKLITQQNDLAKERDSLKAEADSLNQTAQKLNLSTQDYNLGVNQLNNTISTFKEALNQKPEEGIFNSRTQTIDIYFNNSYGELIHTLAHEMGHALGLQHNDNQASIMYPYTTETVVASVDDIKSLDSICAQRYLSIPYVSSWL